MMLGLGAAVSATGQVTTPLWCSLVPAGWTSACAPPTQAELDAAAQNIALCAADAKTTYPIASTLLGAETACHLGAGDYNGRLALGAAALGLLLFISMR